MFVCFLLYIIIDLDHSSLEEAWATLDADDRFLDGGFSRTLHPKCNIELWIPLTLWDITQHTLNPALDRDKVEGFWLTGQRYREVVFNENDAPFNRSSFGR